MLARSLALSHTRARTPARTHTHCAGSLLSLRAVFGHRARASPARPAPSSRAERTIRGPARRGAGRRGPEGAGTPDRGHPEEAATRAEPFVFAEALQGAGAGRDAGLPRIARHLGTEPWTWPLALPPIAVGLGQSKDATSRWLNFSREGNFRGFAHCSGWEGGKEGGSEGRETPLLALAGGLP